MINDEVKFLREEIGYKNVHVIKQGDLEVFDPKRNWCAFDLYQALLPHYLREEPNMSFPEWVKKEYRYLTCDPYGKD